MTDSLTHPITEAESFLRS